MKLVVWRAWFTSNPEKSGYYRLEGAGLPDAHFPNDGCLCVVKYGEPEPLPGKTGATYVPRQVLTGGSWYFWWEGPDGLVISNENDGDLAERYPGCVLVRGRNVTDEVMTLVDQEAMAAKDCPTCGG